MINHSTGIPNTAKQPPAAVEVEVSVLGAILLDEEAILTATEILTPDMFYDKRHRLIFEAAQELFARNLPIDTVSLYEELKKRKQVDDVGGAVYLSKLSQDISSAANIGYHSRIVLEKWILRQLITISMQIAGDAFDNSEDVFDIVEKAQNKLFEISTSGFKKEGAEINVIAKATIEEIEAVKNGDISRLALRTGFTDLDEKIIGLQKSNLIILGARPSQGKTANMLGMARHIAKENYTAIFSLEMSSSSLYARMLVSETGIPYYKVITGNLTTEESAKISRAIYELNKLHLYIDDTSAITPLEIRTKARKLKSRNDLKVIFIDYLQLMRGERNKNREQEISGITQSLKSLAKDLEIPVVALAQLNRAVEARSDKVPQLSDLRDSGDQEQAGDLIMFLFRPESYGIGEYEGHDTKNFAQIIIAKQRNGMTGSVPLRFFKESMRFENYTELF